MMNVTTDLGIRATDMAGNWLRFPCFAWSDQPDDAEYWTIYNTHHRDSGLLDQSNATAIRKALEPFNDGDDPDCGFECHRHWAYGWVECVTVRVYRPWGTLTVAFKVLSELLDRLADYPILDEADYSEREHAAAIDNIEWEGRDAVAGGTPDTWPADVLSWLWEHDPAECENRDDQGAYPARDAIKRARHIERRINAIIPSIAPLIKFFSNGKNGTRPGRGGRSDSGGRRSGPLFHFVTFGGR